ncbi:MAG: hypothetical protein IKD50_04970 [Clostridia bacterium]|nr:hypothetical protein [Clostridia bacterium]
MINAFIIVSSMDKNEKEEGSAARTTGNDDSLQSALSDELDIRLNPTEILPEILCTGSVFPNLFHEIT